MTDRLLSRGAFLTKSLLSAACSIMLMHLPASASLLSAGVDLGVDLEPAGFSPQWSVFDLGVGGDSDVKGNAVIFGDIGVAGTTSAIMVRGSSTIHGNVALRQPQNLILSGNAQIFGSLMSDPATIAELQQGVTDAKNASQAASQLIATKGLPKVIDTNKSLTLSGSGVVVLKLSDFNLTGNAALTLQGDSSTTFVINVKDTFSLSGNSKVVLSGGLTWDNVLFNLQGAGTASLKGSSEVDAVILARNRILEMSGHSVLEGEVIAGGVAVSGASVIGRPPVVSP